MLARSFPNVLPNLTCAEALEVTRIHTIANGHDQQTTLHRCRPFRAPHHTTTMAGMVGDRRLRPGEICLAHRGVLFLDEATEFPRSTLETLRQPLEHGKLRLTRAIGTATYPARFNLILAANPCPCGNYGTRLICGCSSQARKRYISKLSGPILDRIDLHVQLELPSPSALFSRDPVIGSDDIRRRVQRAQTFATNRMAPVQRTSQTDPLNTMDQPARQLLRTSAEALHLSARSISRLSNVSRTIADLEEQPIIKRVHVAEALAYRTGSVR